MNIAIIGTRGIPNHYGGFEQFAEYLSKGLVEKGHQITVYNSHNHPYQKSEWNGVQIIHCKDLDYKFGPAGHFIFDLNCILDSRKRDFELILQLGYTSSSVWGWLLPRKKSLVTTNMDGLEWKRTKYSKPVRQFLKLAERLGVVFSDYLIADSIGIQEHLKKKYHKNSVFIPYGSNPFESPDEKILNEFELKPFQYNLLVARLEPENSIETILDGHILSQQENNFIVIGKHNTPYGTFLKEKYKAFSSIKFIGGVYDIDKLNNIRYYSSLYFHGHTVGGTNPSLLEAMASNALIVANYNIFNHSILEEDGFYFSNANEVAYIIDNIKKQDFPRFLNRNIEKIKTQYNWERITNQYLEHFNNCLKLRNIR